MGPERHPKTSLHRSLLVPALTLAICLITPTTAQTSTTLEVKLVFPGLDQRTFDAQYGTRTRGALALSAGVPESFVTWVNMPAATTRQPTAAAAAAATVPQAGITAASNSTGDPRSAPAETAAVAPASAGVKSDASAVAQEAAQATPAPAPAAAPTPGSAVALNAPSAPSATVERLATGDEASAAPAADASVTVSSSSGSSGSISSKGARRLLAPAAAPVQSNATDVAAARNGGGQDPPQGATGLYRIATSDTESWATPQAVASKLQISAAPPTYAFLANLRRRGVPYEPVMYVNGAKILEGRTTLPSNPQSAPPQAADLNLASSTAPPQAVEQTSRNAFTSLPREIFISILVLGALLAVLLIVGTCVLACLGMRMWQKHRRERQEEKERGQFIKNGDGSDSGSEGLTRAPAGGYAPTEGALAQLNASFPSATGGSKSPGSVASADVRSVTTAFTTATTARSTAGLMAAQDGRKGRAAKNSSSTAGRGDDDLSYIRQYQKEGKPVPIAHSKLIKPGSSSIKVPRPGSTTGSVAGSTTNTAAL